MKVQLRVVMEYSTQWERWLFHFLTSLTQEKNYAHKGLFHFVNELDTGKELCSVTSRFDSHTFVSLFNELSTWKKTMLVTSCFIF
jgi:hypothetical protein